MEGFSRKYVPKRPMNPIRNDYDAQVESNVTKNQMLESKNYQEFATSQQTMHFIKRSYSVVAVGFVGSSMFYPLAVRLVKKLFGLKNFFNIHFAVIPLMLNFNALTVGIVQGWFNFMEIRENYQFKISDVEL